MDCAICIVTSLARCWKCPVVPRRGSLYIEPLSDGNNFIFKANRHGMVVAEMS
jgi:hypothetical protein